MADDDLIADIRAEIRLDRAERADMRQFMRDVSRRNELVWREVTGELRAMRAEHGDHRDETRAQTQAILRLLDRRSRFD